MSSSYTQKYVPYLTQFPVRLPDRTWPDRELTQAPLWCSVDLRDGNQALVNPMTLDEKLELFQLLVAIGFKEIEIGFPSAAQVEFDFARALVERSLVPPDVSPQVLVQCRSHLIDKTFEALVGLPRFIVHAYNSTSELQRRVVFNKSKAEIIDIALSGVRLIKERAKQLDSLVTLQYSPESFTGTELDFALEICEAVIDAWDPSPSHKMIINLPATVELSTPNVYADQIEWFCLSLKRRNDVIVSLHTHNDRGTGVAATELGLLAGADRVEGTLFGNGERTGNVDIVTVALNLFAQGIAPRLELAEIGKIVEVYERTTGMTVHERHPYAGELVFTAFSGSHQDAIHKGMKARESSSSELWEIPYLHIDPTDLGRTYDAVIRINSQSGKGGVAYVMKKDFGCDLPKSMHPEFGGVIQKLSDSRGTEVPASDVWAAFSKEYLELGHPYKFVTFRAASDDLDHKVIRCEVTVESSGEVVKLHGHGNGPVHACHQALIAAGCPPFAIVEYYEHARGAGADADAVAYIKVEFPDGKSLFGAGIDSSTTRAAIKALLSAVNRALGGGVLRKESLGTGNL